MNNRGQATLLKILKIRWFPRKNAVLHTPVKESLLRNTTMYFGLGLEFWWNDVVRLSTEQHGLYNEQKEDALITEHFVRGMHTSSSGVVHHLVPRLRV